MEHTAVLPRIKQSSYVKKLLKIFKILNSTLKTDTFLYVLYKSNQRRHTHPGNHKATTEALEEIKLLEVTDNLDSASYTLREEV